MQIEERAGGRRHHPGPQGQDDARRRRRDPEGQDQQPGAAGPQEARAQPADVPYIDSAGLGEIVRTYTTVSRQGGSLKLLSLTKRITDLLSITKLLTVFETYDNEADAVRSFTRRPTSNGRRGDGASRRRPSARRAASDLGQPRRSAARLAAPGAVDEEPVRLRRAAVRRPADRLDARWRRPSPPSSIFCALSGAVYLVQRRRRSRGRRSSIR